MINVPADGGVDLRMIIHEVGQTELLAVDASMTASLPWKNAVSPPPGCAGPLMITRPMSTPSLASLPRVGMLMTLGCRTGRALGTATIGLASPPSATMMGS